MHSCDNASVGVLIYDDQMRLLLLERAHPPHGWAPPAGHVFDEHGDRAHPAAAYRTAAAAEVAEETGLRVTTLHEVSHQWLPNRCHRGPSADGHGHLWRVYSAAGYTGDVTRSVEETRATSWVTVQQMQQLADRTVAYARGEITDVEFYTNPGLEPVWVTLCVMLDMVRVNPMDLARVRTMFTADPADMTSK